MATKPTINNVRWATGGAAVIGVIPEGKKDIGWTESEFPPIDWFNYWWNQIYQWMQFLDELDASQVAFDNTTPQLPNAPADIAAAIQSLLDYTRERRSVQFNGDIAGNSPKRLLYKVGDENAITRATLFIKGFEFSRFHYSEMPNHTHADNFAVANAGSHTHTFNGDNNVETSEEGLHIHDFGNLAGTTDLAPHLRIQWENGTSLVTDNDGRILETRGNQPSAQYLRTPQHSHDVTLDSGITGSNGSHTHTVDISGSIDAAGTHSHTLTGSISANGPSGVGGLLNTGAAFGFFDDLQIILDGVNITSDVLTLIGGGITKIGDGTDGSIAGPNNEVVNNGHELDLVALDTAIGGGLFTNGNHEIEFTCTATSGGELVANLEIN